MALQETHPWTLEGLIGAFIDLVAAYFLLCGLAFAFFASKFTRFFGLYFPCPCMGCFGYKNSSFCFHRLLFEWPSRKICSIQVMAAKRFPLYQVFAKGNNESVFMEKSENRVVEWEDEASCSTCLGSPLLKENGFDGKGKRIMSLKKTSGIRQRQRRGCDDSEKEVRLLDDEDAETCLDFDRKNRSMVDSPSSSENYMSNEQDSVQMQGNGEEERIEMLEAALEEEKAASAVLYLELEKERAAAASAADEAMAMISRLQEEKASVEMEMMQYQRMIEERVVYDEEELNILQEIIMRREMENHLLETELESYRRNESIASKKARGSNIASDNLVPQVCTGEQDEEENNGETGDSVDDYSFYDTEADILDLDAVDDSIEVNEEEENNKKINSFLFSSVSSESGNSYLEIGSVEVHNSNAMSNGPRTSKIHSGRDSACSDNNGKIKFEIEILRERLKVIQQERERNCLSLQRTEKVKKINC